MGLCLLLQTVTHSSRYTFAAVFASVLKPWVIYCKCARALNQNKKQLFLFLLPVHGRALNPEPPQSVNTNLSQTQTQHSSCIYSMVFPLLVALNQIHLPLLRWLERAWHFFYMHHSFTKCCKHEGKGLSS